ncbi:MAG: hypothetical protein ACYCUG_16195 [Acidimicrobiales bacterium]
MRAAADIARGRSTERAISVATREDAEAATCQAISATQSWADEVEAPNAGGVGGSQHVIGEQLETEARRCDGRAPARTPAGPGRRPDYPAVASAPATADVTPREVSPASSPADASSHQQRRS